MSHELRGITQQPIAESIGSTDDKKPGVNELHATTTVDTGDVIEASGRIVIAYSHGQYH